jgi:hypothetical protein
MGWQDGNLSDLIEDRDMWQAVVSTVMNLRVPQNAWNFLTGWDSIRKIRKWTLFIPNVHMFIMVTIDC